MPPGITLELLQQRLKQPDLAVWTPEWPAHPGLVEAAVLIPLVERSAGLQVVLTRRAEHLHHHAGQISFPGGRFEEHDASLVAAALRETSEEIGVPAESVDVIRTLPAFATPSGFRITPVLGSFQAGAAFSPDPFEVAEIFEVPLSFLIRRENYQQHRICWQGGVRHVQAVPYQGRFIWGATAGILDMLAQLLRAAGESPECAPDATR